MSQAGLSETSETAQQNKEELVRQQEALTEQEKKVAANQAAIAAAAARFGQLTDYYLLDEVTIYFANGKEKVDPKYSPQLVSLAEKSKTINGYMIQVKGYASSSGSAALNQKLSEERADHVVNLLLQEGHFPLTN